MIAAGVLNLELPEGRYAAGTPSALEATQELMDDFFGQPRNLEDVASVGD